VADAAPLTTADAEALRREAGTWLAGVAPWQVMPSVVSTRTNSWHTLAVGTWTDFLRVGGWQIAEGRAFDEVYIKKSAPVCLIGQTVRRKLFPQGDPIGQWVRVNQVRLRVIGVLASRGATPLGMDQDDQLFLPLPLMQHKLAGNDHLAMILAIPHSPEDGGRAKEEITRVLRRHRHLRPGTGNPFDVSSVGELARFAVVLTDTMRLLIVVIASIALVVGGIGIMNMMLASVTERTREIGIRMAVGATPSAVLLQFLLEAVVLAVAGGIVGVTLGVGVALGLARLASWPVVLSPLIVAIALLVTAAVGVFFGFYPALRASRLDPIQALSHD
jgi:putative ABC transport system permease protein